jgi:predicted transcriptional regulator
MKDRRLTITLRSDWRAALRDAAGKAASARTYQGEILNFESPAAFFGKLTERRWAIVRELQTAGATVGVRELARKLGRDVKRVHEDAAALVALGLIERTEEGALRCPYEDIHVDMHLAAAA